MTHCNLQQPPHVRSCYPYNSLEVATSGQISSSPSISPMNSVHSRCKTPIPAHASSAKQLLSSSMIGNGFDDNDENGPRAITSQWKVGWKTPTMLISLYFAALASAIGHLIFFLKLDGRHVDDYHIPQSYIITISTLIATFWNFCLSLCLSIAFTQTLWSHLRRNFISVRTIEKLHGLLGNVFHLRTDLIASMPALVLIAVISWSLSVVKTFPPGALTVEILPYSNTTNITIPLYNSSFVGNGTRADLSNSMPSTIGYQMGQTDIKISTGNPPEPNSLQRTINRFFATGELQPYASPCGANCSYAFEIEGPYFECSAIDSNTTTTKANNIVSAVNTSQEYYFYKADYNLTTLNIQKFRPIDVPITPLPDGSYSDIANRTLVSSNHLTCHYATALYNVNITYIGGFLHATHTARPLGLLNHAKNCQTIGTILGFSSISLECSGHNGKDGLFDRGYLTESGQKTFAGTKTYLLAAYLLTILRGDMSLHCSGNSQTTNGRIDVQACIRDLQDGLHTVSNSTSSLINTFIYDIPSNDLSVTPRAQQPKNQFPLLHTSADELNAALFNLSMIYMYSSYNPFNTTVVATQNRQLLTFVFSRPRNLILPYFIPLGVTIPVLIYALVLLYHKHHVAAMSDSFIQILMTTTGTKTLTDAAAGGCLGGTDNIPEQLNNLEIKFGDITESADGADSAVRRAGFGVEGEVYPLRKRAVYGYVPAG